MHTFADKSPDGSLMNRFFTPLNALLGPFIIAHNFSLNLHTSILRSLNSPFPLRSCEHSAAYLFNKPGPVR